MQRLAERSPDIPGMKFAQPRNVCRFADLGRLHDRVARDLVEILRKITDQGDGDEVQHDRVYHLMRTEFCF